MKNNGLLGAIIVIISLILAVVLYVVVFTQFDKVWFSFVPVFILCVITFAAAIGIIICAVIAGRKMQ